MADNINRDKIENQINLSDGSIYIENQTLVIDGGFDISLDMLVKMVWEKGIKIIRQADKNYNAETITEAIFHLIQGRAQTSKELPQEIKDDLISGNEEWVRRLKKKFGKIPGIVINEKSSDADIFKHYGWLIETFLLKMKTPPAKENQMRRLSFMVEAYQATLRYLCYIQVSQLLHSEQGDYTSNLLMKSYLNMKPEEHHSFDYLNLLLSVTELVHDDEQLKGGFVPEIKKLTEKMYKRKDLLDDVLFLEIKREQFIQGQIQDNEKLTALNNEYLTALVFWLQELTFLAQYSLYSIKDIDIDYRAGEPTKRFRHNIGELHGVYKAEQFDPRNGGNYAWITTENEFTYNKSVILVKRDSTSQLREYISLSPLLIDESVFNNQPQKPKQTPEIYYFAGTSKKCYKFLHYQNELFPPSDSEKDKSKVKMSERKLLIERYSEGSEDNSHSQNDFDDFYEYIQDTFN